MQATRLPNEAKAGPTKAEVRAALKRKLALVLESPFVAIGRRRWFAIVQHL